MKLLLLFCVVSQCAALWITQSDTKPKSEASKKPTNSKNKKNGKTKGQKMTADYGYVTMWVSKKAIPGSVDMSRHILSTSERRQQWKELMAEEAMHTSQYEHNHTEKVRSLKEKNTEQLEYEEGAAGEMMNTYWQEEEGAKTKKGVQRVLKMAESLVKLNAKYPLIVVTNEPDLIAISRNVTLLQMHPNIVIKEIHTDEWLEISCAMNPNNLVHFQKLSVFGLVQYSKLLWLDLDVNVHQNIDFVFEKHDLGDGGSIVGQQDNWVRCEEHRNKFCSGMMLFKPSLKHFVGVQRTAASMGNCWGDQTIIEKYFKDKSSGRQIELFDQRVVNFKKCQNEDAPTPMVGHHSDR